MKRRFRQEREVANGWSRWIQPVKRGYLMACCDCGLVHRMNFRIVEGRVQFKAQRAKRLTSAQRSSAIIKSLVRQFAPTLKRLAGK